MKRNYKNTEVVDFKEDRKSKREKDKEEYRKILLQSIVGFMIMAIIYIVIIDWVWL